MTHLTYSFKNFASLASLIFHQEKIGLRSGSRTLVYSADTDAVTESEMASAFFESLSSKGDILFSAPLSDQQKLILEKLQRTFETEIAAQSLKESTVESRFNAIFLQSPLSIQICSRDGKTILVNPAWKKLWGIPEDVIENFILKDYNMLEDPNLKAQGVMEHIRRGFSGEVSRIPIIRYDVKGLGIEGSVRSVEGWIYPLKDSDGHVQEIVLIHIDVTEKEELLSQLTVERNRFEAVLSQLPVGVLVLDKSTNTFVLTNKEMEQIQGQVPMGLQLSSSYAPRAFHEDGREYELSEWPLRRSVDRGEIVKGEEFDYQKANGERVRLRTNSAPLRNAEGEIVAGVVVATDVTKENKNEKALKFLSHVNTILNNTLKYEETIAKIAEACVPEIADGCIVDLLENGEIKRVVTKHRLSEVEELLVELQQKFPPTTDSPQPSPRAIRSGRPDLLPDVDLSAVLSRTMNKEHADLIARIGIHSHLAVPICIRGQIIGAVSLLQTTSRLKFTETDLETCIEIARRAGMAIENARLYRSAQQAVIQRDEFISIASHELKTPLTSMKLQLQLVDKVIQSSENGMIEGSFVKKVTDVTTRQINRFTMLVEDMLDISRITSGKLAIAPKETNVTELVQEVVSRFSPQLSSEEIALEVKCEENVKAICDAFRIEQVFTNLLSNAIRYGQKKPVRIELFRDGEDVVLSVIDQGTGIEAHDQERVFQRFERAVNARNSSGLGLGLFISRQIMELHQGTLTVKSTPGRGSTFTARWKSGIVL